MSSSNFNPQTSTQAINRSGFAYFFYGLKLCFSPGIRRFVFIPMLLNILLFGGGLYYLYINFEDWINKWILSLPDYLSWIGVVIEPLLVLTLVALFSYFFSTISNILAAPFNGLLAEKLEIRLTGHSPNDDSLFSMLKDVPRILAREWTKLKYYIPKAIGLFILLFIPLIGQTLGPILWFLFSAWMMAIQYCDYPFDNHKISFEDMKSDLRQDKFTAYSFGSLVAICTMIPLLNLIVMPVAVCGATAMWVEKYKIKHPQHARIEEHTSDS